MEGGRGISGKGVREGEGGREAGERKKGREEGRRTIFISIIDCIMLLKDSTNDYD